MGSTLDRLGLVDTTVGTIGAVNDVAKAGAGGTGLGIPGGFGLALSGYGFKDSIDDISANGANGENVSNAVFSGTGVASGIASFGGGVAAGVAAPLLTSFAAGGAIGNAGNAYAKRKGYAGKGADGENRNYSEMASDWGVAAKEWGGDGMFGDALGLGATFAGSLYGTAGVMLNTPAAIIDGVTDMVTGPSPYEQMADAVVGRKQHDMRMQSVMPTEQQLIRRMQGQGAAVQQAHKK